MGVFDKTKKQQLQNLIDQINKVPISENPFESFKNNQQILLGTFNHSIESLNNYKSSLQPLCIKLATTLIPFINDSIQDLEQIQQPLEYILKDYVSKDTEVIKQLLQFIHQIIKADKIVKQSIVLFSFKRLHDIQQYTLSQDTKQMLEETYLLLIIYIYSEASEDVRQKFDNYFLFCLQSQEKTFYINGHDIQKMPSLFVLQIIKNIIKQNCYVDTMKNLLQNSMLAKFQSQYLPENTKYLQSGKIPEQNVDWSNCSIPLLLTAVKETKLKQQQAYQCLIVNIQVQIACLKNVDLELTFTLIKTLYDQLNQIQEKQEWQSVLIYSAILVILRNLQQTRNLEAEFMVNIINTISTYLISTQQVKQEQLQYIVDPVHIIAESFKIQKNHYFKFFDLNYFINPLHYNYIVSRYTAELNSCFILEQIICIMQAYSDEKFNPNPKLEQELIDISQWIYQVFGQSNIPFYTIKITTQFLCKLVLNIDKGIDYNENQITETTKKQKAQDNKEEQVESEIQQEENYRVNQLRKRTIEEINSILKLLLSTPKRLLNRDENQIWATPYKIQNHISMIAFYNELAYIFPMLQHIQVNHWIEFNFLSINLLISTFMVKNQTDEQVDFIKIQKLIEDNIKSGGNMNQDTPAKEKIIFMLVERFNSIYHLQTDKTDGGNLARTVEMKNYLTYLNSLCQIQLNEDTPQKIAQLFGQIMLDEFIFSSEQEFPIVLQVCQSELFSTLLQVQLNNDNMKSIARRALVELMIYQYIAWELEKPHQIDSFFDKIVNYFKQNKEVAEHHKNIDYFQMFEQMASQGNSLFILQLLCQVIDFAIMNSMNLIQKEKIITFIQVYYQSTTINCANDMIKCLKVLSQKQIIQQFDEEQQKILYDIFTDVVVNYYKNQLKFEVEKEELQYGIINFFLCGNTPTLVRQFYDSIIQLFNDNCENEINIDKLIDLLYLLITQFKNTVCFQNETMNLGDLDNQIEQYASLFDTFYQVYREKPTENKVKLLDMYITKYIDLLKFLKEQELVDQLRNGFKLLVESIKQENKDIELYNTHMLYFFRLLSISQIAQLNDDLFDKINNIILQNPEHIYNEESLQNYKTYIVNIYTQRQDHHQDIASQLLFLAGKHDELVAAGAITVPQVQQPQQVNINDPKLAQLQEKLSHIQAQTMAGKILIYYKEMIQQSDDQEFLISQCEKIYSYTLTTQNITSNRQHMMIIKQISSKVDDKQKVFQLYKEFYLKVLEKENITKEQFTLFTIIYIFLLIKIQKAQIEIPQELIDLVFDQVYNKDITYLQVKEQMLLFLQLDIDKYQNQFIQLAKQLILYLMPQQQIEFTDEQLIVIEQKAKQVKQQEQPKEEVKEDQQQQDNKQQEQQQAVQQTEQIDVQESQKANLREFLQSVLKNSIQVICLNNKDKQFIQDMIINLAKQIVQMYQANTVNEQCMEQFLKYIITNWPQLTVKYYRAFSALFSKENHLVEVRTLFYDTVADFCKFE